MMSILQCTLSVLPDVNYDYSLDDRFCIVSHISISTLQIYTLLYARYRLKKNWTGFTVTLIPVVCQKKKMTLQYHCDIEMKKTRGTKGKIQNQKGKHRKHPLGGTLYLHAALCEELQCSLSTPHDVPVCRATDSHPHHIGYLHLQCNVEKKKTFGMSYPASAGIFCDVLTCCFHGSQQGHLSTWLVIIDLHIHAEQNSSIGLRNGK